MTPLFYPMSYRNVPSLAGMGHRMRVGNAPHVDSPKKAQKLGACICPIVMAKNSPCPKEGLGQNEICDVFQKIRIIHHIMPDDIKKPYTAFRTVGEPKWRSITSKASESGVTRHWQANWSAINGLRGRILQADTYQHMINEEKQSNI